MNRIIFKTGDLFKSNRQTLVNTINCVGVMGAGIAKKAKQLFPLMYREYVQLCKDRCIQPGKPYLWKNPDAQAQWILNFPTKDHWKAPSQLEWIEQGLDFFVKNYKDWGVQSIAFPALGCGHGGLWWIDVKPVMEKYLGNVDLPLEIYRPQLTSAEKALMHVKSDLLLALKDKITDIELVRSMYSGNDKWSDWTRAKTLTIRIIVSSETTWDFENIQSVILKTYGIMINFKVTKN